MGDLDIHLETIAERFCREESCYELRSNREVAHIFRSCTLPHRKGWPTT